MSEKEISPDDPRLVYVKVTDAIIPPNGIIEHFKDRHWVTHPERGLVYWRSGKDHLSPLCNGNKDLVEMGWRKFMPWMEVQFIPSVFRKINPRDYV